MLATMPSRSPYWVIHFAAVLGPDPGHAGQVVRALTDHGREVAVAGRGDAVLLLDLLGTHAPHLGDAADGVEDRHPVGDELERVTVTRADEDVDVLGLGLRGDRRDDVVGLVAVELDERDAQRVEDLLDERDLPLELVGSAGAARLVVGVLLGAERVARLVEGHHHVRRLLVAQHVDEHRGEAVDGVGVLPGARGEVLGGEREERAIGQRVSVEEE